nr:hypothetical protein [Devosia sp. JXJ CY 41]
MALDNPDRALTFIDELYQACSELASGPMRFALLPRFEHRAFRRRVHGR